MGSLSAIVFGGIQPAYSYALGSMISVYFLTDHDEIKNKTRAYALIFVGLAVLSFLINIGQHYNFGVMGEYLTKRVKIQMLTKILTFEIGCAGPGRPPGMSGSGLGGCDSGGVLAGRLQF